jgi:ABC-type Zn uptake system ZnuABC Zn-binding protein ZnuA
MGRVLRIAVLATVAACGGTDRPRVGCGDGDPVRGREPTVAASVAPITDIVATIAEGTGVTVVGLVPEGVDSHTFEPAPSVAAAVADADVVFINGLGLEQPLARLAAANLRGDAELCELGTAVLPEDEYVFDRSFPRGGGDPNPHLWTNPPMALEYAELVRDVLAARIPSHAERLDANLAAFTAQVEALDTAIRTATASIPPERRLLLTYHDAYAYFAIEYGWTVIGAVQPASFAEPSPREVAALVDQIRAEGVTTVFGSEVFPSPVLEQIARESGARYVADLRDDDLPGEPGDRDHSWLGLMVTNTIALVEGLGGDATALRAVHSVSDMA